MILFKACPRCGGDVDATYQDDVYCVQCGNRPHVAFPGPRVVANPDTSILDAIPARVHPPCPKCGSANVGRLDKARPDFNTCYRCFPCGHIYSPNQKQLQKYNRANEV